MLTEDSTSAFLIFESVNPERHDELAAAVSELADRISKYLGGEIKVQKILNKRRLRDNLIISFYFFDDLRNERQFLFHIKAKDTF